MKWLRRIALALLGTVLLVTVVGAGSVMSVKMTNSRDEDAFLRDLASCCRYDHKAVFMPADKGDLIASGDQACAWLREQPYPWWRGGEKYSFDGMIARYKDTMSDREWRQGTDLPRPGVVRLRAGAGRGLLQGELVQSAWRHLCGEAWELREPLRS
jgi:hypothetical protein